MAWDFETDPEFQAQLDWADEFVQGGGRAARPGLARTWQFTPARTTRRGRSSTR